MTSEVADDKRAAMRALIGRVEDDTAILWHLGQPDLWHSVMWVLAEERRLAAANEMPGSDRWAIYALRRQSLIDQIEQFSDPIEPDED